MGSVVVDAGGATWWIAPGGRLIGAVSVPAALCALAATSSDVVGLDDEGRLWHLAGHLAGAPAPLAALEPAADVALDRRAGVAYLATPRGLVARGVGSDARRELLALDAAALVLTPDRRRLYVADPTGRRVIGLHVAGGDASIEVEVALPGDVALGDGPLALGLTSAGLVVACGRAVLGVNLRHATCTVVHGPAAALALVAARGIAASRDRRTLWVADGDRLIAVASDGTGARVALDLA